ncbi:DUF3352 domain-containing protein [Kribbella sp. CA-294648]|uniref:DUF3352 domain-containing protein n=1 Tax=Kribbella sp. CA-294648 TaxID=3239948 RepID=UPI003D911A1C
MSDYTNPPAGGHHPGAAGGPQGGQPPHNPYSAPQGQQPGYAGGQPQGQQPGYAGGGQPPHGQPQYQPGQPQYQPGQPQQGQPPYQAGQPGQPQAPQYGAGQPQAPQFGQGQPQYQQGGQSWQQPDYPQQMHGGGGQPPYGSPETMQWQPEPKKRGKLVPLIAVLAVLAVVTGGGIFAYARLAGGDQPAAVLPGNSMAYARIDLNPSAGQKVAAVRFMLKFPSAKEKMGLTSDQDDLRQKLFDLIKKDAGDDLADVDFEKDIKPWLGDRAGVAAIPGQDGKDPDALVAIEVKDQDKANAGLDKLFSKEEKKPGRAFSNGYVLISEEQSIVDAAVANSKETPLSENATFKADMDSLGEQGFASFWADMKGVAAAAGERLPEAQRNALPSGSMAAALRFDSQYVELKGIAHGDKSVKVNASGAGDHIAKLPDTTAGAIALSDGANLVDTMWTQLQKSAGGANLPEMAKKFGSQYGLTLPDDLKPLLGKNVAIAIDKGSSDSPKIAARMETDPAQAEQVVDKVTNLIRSRTSANIPIRKAKDDKTFVIATDQDYADLVLKGGNLGGTEAFKQAVPDTSGAVMVGYVDFEAISSLSKRTSSNPDYAALRSAGISSRVTDDGEGEFTVRVVAK